MYKMDVEKTKKRKGFGKNPFSQILICACILLSTGVFGNNVRFNSKPDVVVNGDTVVISISLSWDNSWRDEFNWDAVWVFGKYSKGAKGAWNHLKLSPTGHIMPPGFTYDAGNINANNAGGLFLMRDGNGGGKVNNQTFTIKVPLVNLSSVTEQDINKNNVFISFQAIEMVYIPYGGYYLGDGATPNRLGNSIGAPIAVNSEDALSVYPVTAGTVGAVRNLPATFPKGYKGFYCMKYEVSQEQYVGFLNTLTRAQQKARIGNNLDELKAGEYVFGDKLQPSYRNGICVLSNTSSQPAIFGCNLNPVAPYFGEDDGQCIACNYLTPIDMLVYCDWACLRPMSELEYEKACRKPYPQEVVAGEYVWNSASSLNGLNAQTGLLNLGTFSEKPNSAATNVNYNNPDFGPVRSASFGTSSSTQAQAGATFWGLMEMSGNVAEICYSVDAGSYFNTSNIYDSHGNGELTAAATSDISTSIWPNAMSSFIVKGGSFATANTDELRISDRTHSTVTDKRDSTMGFRAVHTFGGSVAVDAGIIKVSTGCTNGINVRDSVNGSLTWNGVAMNMRITYVWYVQKGSAAWELVPDAVSESLTYVPASFTEASRIFKFKRKAITTLGEATTTEVSTTVPNLTISLSSASATLNCGITSTVTASVPYTSSTPTFTWITQTGTKTGAKYTTSYSDFTDGTEGTVTVECEVAVAGCVSTADLSVNVTNLNKSFAKCGDCFKDSRDGQSYPTVEIGEQCWMAKNMNIGECVNGGTSTQNTAGIQRTCYDNNESNCDTYGGLYNWWETVYGENTTDIKYATDGSDHVQGICPDGWHVPSDGDFKTLERSIGMPENSVNSSGDHWSRDSGYGSKLKSETMNGTNSTGWSGLPGGIWGSYFGTYGLWWSSSEYDSSSAWDRALYVSSSSTYRNIRHKSIGMSVRCLLN
ncbi:MAG: SUMF1/EgtB/PvdO family nonheme iron enzyme [Culturomica sp.]|jgi:uncharacterized protein (TIGR02145 family)|nr:SUMF1/EgtB/PvdO family nonheme iron enzyme [Culturomica sp.]